MTVKTAKIDENGNIEVHVPVLHGEYPLQEFFKKTHKCTPIKGEQLIEAFGIEVATKMIKGILEHIPVISEYVSGSNCEEGYFYLESFYGTPEQFRSEAEAYLDAFILDLFDGGGDGDYFDYLPSATEEFVFLCEQIGAIDLIQKLYDSIWQEDHAYHPFNEIGDVQMYRNFENIEGVTLNPDHPSRLSTIKV